MSDLAPLVCICVPTYNVETTIKEALGSILSQTYKNLKVIVFDNASTDRTVSIVNSFKDNRLIVHQNDTNIGAVKNFNLCIELSEGQYTAMFHADEIFEKEMVAKQVAILESSSQVGAVFTEAYLIDDEGVIFGETKVAQYVGRKKGGTVVFDFKELFPKIVRYGNFLLCSGAMVRTAILKTEICFWDTDRFGTSCDLDVWLRILEQHKIGVILEKLMRTRTTQTQASFHELRRNTNRADMFLVLDHYLEKYCSKGIVSTEDIDMYEALQRMDTSRRAMNFYLTARKENAKNLLVGMPVWDLVKFSFYSKRGLLTFFLVGYLKTVLLFGFDTLGVRILRLIAAKTKR